MAKIKLDDTLAIYTNNAKSKGAGRKLIISTHGGWQDGDGTFTLSAVNGIGIGFYSSEDYCVSGKLSDALSGTVKTIEAATTSVKNYELTRFEHDPNKSDLEPSLTDEFDALKVRTKFNGSRRIRLREAILKVQAKGFTYSEVCCLFCRYTGVDKSSSARDRTKLESERLGMMSANNAMTQDLKNSPMFKNRQ